MYVIELSYIFVIFSIFVSIKLSTEYAMIKMIDDDIYIGGKNHLSKYKIENEQLKLIIRENFIFGPDIMNGSDKGFDYKLFSWPGNFSKGPTLFAFDTCLNWKQEHPDKSVRLSAFDYQHWKYHTPSGDWNTMNYTCMNSFIKSVEKVDNNTLWVCGTFGAFPRAFLVNKIDLKFIKFIDVNVMSCARYEDEPMATHRDKLGNLYVASGWGLYRPDKNHPDVPDNNSTMLYADWRLYRNLFTLPSAMAWVLSSDVNFINVVNETDDHLYFFGHEINNQYGLNNQEDRNSWQSFMVRICKYDLGFKYIPTEIQLFLKHSTSADYYMGRFSSPYVTVEEDFMVSPYHDHLDYNKSWYDDSAHLPKKHFVTPLKVNFGCYIGKRPRAISDNYFWGDTNIIYLNKLADVIFDPSRKIKFRSKGDSSIFGCANQVHQQIPLLGIFNREGLSGTSVEPTGALCHLQINENIFNEMGTKRSIYNKHNILQADNAYEEIMALSSTSYSNFYSRTIHRTNGYTTHPYWNQGVLMGTSYKDIFKNIGKCQSVAFYKDLNVKKFLDIQNISNIAWPNELPNRLSSIPSSICQYSAAELYSFNASFVLPRVEFKKLFLLKENITNYNMNNLTNLTSKTNFRRFLSPLMIVSIISTTGHLYRVVLCDFDNGMLNHGEDKTSAEWYNWCIFRHTDQPYLYRQYAPMERREWGESYQYRASSLLQEKKIVEDKEASSDPIYRDPQFHVVKDVLRKDDYLHVLTTNNLYSVNIQINCNTEYKTCIDCASDPDCMWNNRSNECIKYDENQYKNSIQFMVQDVLDRGFKCAIFIKNSSKTINIKNLFETKVPLMLSCINAGFWRGKIQWKINNNKSEIKHDSNKYLINFKEKYLTILPTNDIIDNVSCYGVKDDHDKLYDNKEYDWITSNNQLYNYVLLYTYKNVEDSDSCTIYKIIIGILIILLFIFILWLLIEKKRLGNKRKSKRSFCARDTLIDELNKGEQASLTDKRSTKSL